MHASQSFTASIAEKQKECVRSDIQYQLILVSAILHLSIGNLHLVHQQAWKTGSNVAFIKLQVCLLKVAGKMVPMLVQFHI